MDAASQAKIDAFAARKATQQGKKKLVHYHEDLEIMGITTGEMAFVRLGWLFYPLNEQDTEMFIRTLSVLQCPVGV